MNALRSGITLALLCGAAAAQTARIERNLVFAERGEHKLHLDVHYPKTDQRPVPFGLVIHGGGWNRGNKIGADAVTLCRLLNAHGLAAVSIDYRLAPKHVFPAQIEDCRRALQWIRTHADRLGLDPCRVAAIGSSAGAHLAALLAVEDDHARPDAKDPVARQSTRVTCLVSFFGPMRLLPDPKVSRRGQRIVERLFGHPDADDPATIELARSASPIHHLSADDPPILFIHGERDPLVPFSQSEQMAAACTELGVNAEVVPIANGRHGDFMMQLMTIRDRGLPEFARRTYRFLDTHLELPPTPEPPAKDTAAPDRHGVDRRRFSRDS